MDAAACGSCGATVLHGLVESGAWQDIQNGAWLTVGAMLGVLGGLLLKPFDPRPEPVPEKATSGRRRATPWLRVGAFVTTALLLFSAITVIATPQPPAPPPRGSIASPLADDTVPSLLDIRGEALVPPGWSLYLLTHDLWKPGLFQASERIEANEARQWNATIPVGDENSTLGRPFMIELVAVQAQGEVEVEALLAKRRLCDYDAILPPISGAKVLASVVVKRGAFVPHAEPPQCHAQRPHVGGGEWVTFTQPDGYVAARGLLTLGGSAGTTQPARSWHLVKFSEGANVGEDACPYWPQGRVGGLDASSMWSATLDMSQPGRYRLTIGHVDDAGDTGILQWLAERGDDPQKWARGMCTYPEGFKPMGSIWVTIT